MDDLTAFIGRNSVGKSTILEALEIFFNNETVKIEPDDLNIEAQKNGEEEIEISCKFVDLPDELVIDTQKKTSLKEEHLAYYDEGQWILEVTQKFDAGKVNPKPVTYVRSLNYPIKDGYDELHSYKISDLKKYANQLGIDFSEVDQTSSSSLRKGIWDHAELQSSDFGEKLINVDEEEYGKKIWKPLSSYLPFYALFKSDRSSTDADEEVQNPISIAVKEAVRKYEDKLKEIEEGVTSIVADVAERTAKKLYNLAPEWSDNDQLNPQTAKKINWAKEFKYKVSGSDEVPINKYGSGMRRLTLLAFFQAEVDRRLEEENATDVIYAIEEPETSQHPDHQLALVESLKELSENENTQIILTTHVPGLAEKLNSKSIRFIREDDSGKLIRHGGDILEEVAKTLGVLPDPNNRVKVIVMVEGKHDVAFLKRISAIIHERDPSIPNLETDERVVIIPTGGSTLKDFINEQYLKKLNKIEFHLYDADDSEYKEHVEQVNSEDNNNVGFITKRLEIENYIPPSLFQSYYKNRDKEIELPVSFGEQDDVPDLVSQAVYEYDNPGCNWSELSNKKKKNYHSRLKSRVEEEILPNLTYEHLEQIGAIEEIYHWFNKLNELLELES